MGTCALGQVMRGREHQTNLPAVVFVLLPEQCSESDRRWLLVRQLRPRPEVVGPTVIEVQSNSKSAFVCVAWPATSLDPSFTPPELEEVIGSFVSGIASISVVLAKLAEIEPRSVPATVAINSQQMPAVWPPRGDPPAATALAGASSLPEPATPTGAVPIGQTRLLPSDAPLATPTPERSRSPAPAGRTPAPTRSPAAAATASARPSPLPARPRNTPAPDERMAPRNRRRVPAPVLWLGPSALVIVVLLIVWAFTRPEPTPSGVPPTPVALPQALPEPVQLAQQEPASGLEATTAAPADAPPVNEAPSTPDEESDSLSGLKIVVISSPAGAQLCDPRAGKAVGNTPLEMPLAQWRRGHKLVVTAPGYKPAELRWPPKRKIRLQRLGDDEVQTASPCVF